MAKVNCIFHIGWAQNNDFTALYTENHKRILQFFVFETPCLDVSSSGRSLQDRGWQKDVWKKPELRSALLAIANLVSGVSYCKTESPERMTDCYSSVNLGSGFPHNRDNERVAYYHNKGPEILEIWYYIRCAFAHGRFAVYGDSLNQIYAFEAIKKMNSLWTSRARMILKEKTLIQWINIIDGQQIWLDDQKTIRANTIVSQVIEYIRTTPKTTKNRIIDQFPGNKSFVGKIVTRMTKENTIRYNSKTREWTVPEVNALRA